MNRVGGGWMRRRYFAVILILCLIWVPVSWGGAFWAEPRGERGKIPITSETVPALVKKLKPSVVNISVVKVERVMTSPFPGPGLGPRGGMDPFRDFWERFFGDRMPREFRQRGLGSGFIISKDGYILTNHHVIQDADQIQVTLHDKQEYSARVVGVDPKTDIALIKIEPEEPLTAAVLGNSDILEQGEPVVAIGNPFGLAETVTTGIVSATGRVIGAGPYDNFIQTDASINPGNSGGPLFSFHGDVVGINTAIVAAGQGIGFAVPINMVKQILVALKDEGRVTRGWLGVAIQNITPELARSFKLTTSDGALVADVTKGGPADEAKIRRGDVIVEFDGEPVTNSSELPQMVANRAPGTRVNVTILREGKKHIVPVTLGTLKDTPPVQVETSQRKRFGMSVQTVTPELAKALGLDKAQGVIITGVEPGGPAAEAGLNRGDVILEVNHREVKSVEDFRQAVSETQADAVLLLVWREGNTFFATLPL